MTDGPRSGALGIFGGTFDPPNLGHLILAEAALDECSLGHVLFAPAADPPHKRERRVTPVVHRLAMLRLALAGNPRFGISLVDVERPGPHYTVDMLAILAGQHPEADLSFIIGADSLRDMLTWRDPVGIVAQARIIAVHRVGVTVDVAALEANLPGLKGRVSFISVPMNELSSTLIRERLQAGRSIRYLVPEAVERYIHEQGLYRD